MGMDDAWATVAEMRRHANEVAGLAAAAALRMQATALDSQADLLRGIAASLRGQADGMERTGELVQTGPAARLTLAGDEKPAETAQERTDRHVKALIEAMVHADQPHDRTLGALAVEAGLDGNLDYVASLMRSMRESEMIEAQDPVAGSAERVFAATPQGRAWAGIPPEGTAEEVASATPGLGWDAVDRIEDAPTREMKPDEDDELPNDGVPVCGFRQGEMACFLSLGHEGHHDLVRVPE